MRGAAGDPVHAARPAREDRCAQRHGSYFADRVLSGGPNDPDSTLGGPWRAVVSQPLQAEGRLQLVTLENLN